MRIVLIILISCLSTTVVYSQVSYFNSTYNYNDFSPSIAIIELQGNYIFSGVTYDSTNTTISKYTARLDSIGNIISWHTISDEQSYYWAGYAGYMKTINNLGFVSVGCVQHIDRTNAILYRYSYIGDTLWTKQYPDTINNMWTQFWNCNTTHDNGFINVGNHTVEAYTVNILLNKTDSIGIEQWRREYGVAGWIKHGYSVVQTPDNGYLIGHYEYIAGQDDSGDPVVMKVDSVGNVEWEKNLGGPYRDFFTQVCLGNDGNYIAGTSLSDSTSGDNHFSRIKIYKLSQSGDIIWENYYCMTELDNKLYSICPDHNGGYIATGHRNNKYHPGHWGFMYGWLIKIDEDGDSVWYREYQYYTATEDDKNYLYDLCLTPDGGYAMVGQVSTWTEPQTAWVIKVDSMGCDTPGCSIGVGIEIPPSLVPRTPYPVPAHFSQPRYS